MSRERKKIVAYLVKRAKEIGDGPTRRATAAERQLLRRRLLNVAEEVEQGMHL